MKENTDLFIIQNNPEFVKAAQSYFKRTPHLTNGSIDTYIGNNLWLCSENNRLIAVHQNHPDGSNLLRINIIDDHKISFCESEDTDKTISDIKQRLGKPVTSLTACCYKQRGCVLS